METNLTNFLTGIANAIREKKGTTGSINPQDFATEIRGIQTGSSSNIHPMVYKYKLVATGIESLSLTLYDENDGVVNPEDGDLIVSGVLGIASSTYGGILLHFYDNDTWEVKDAYDSGVSNWTINKHALGYNITVPNAGFTPDSTGEVMEGSRFCVLKTLVKKANI